MPATGAVNENVGFAATATTSGCATQPSFEWNFGDGTARSNQQNPTHAYLAAGAYTWTLTTTASTGSTVIDTIAGGLGEGNLATQSPFGTVVAVARDPQNRGIYIADIIGGTTLIRFINTSNSTVTIAGRSIAPGVVRAVAGGGADLGENIAGLKSDLGVVAGLDTSADGNLLYYIAQADGQVRALNVSSSNMTVGVSSIAPGNIGTLASGFNEKANGLAVSPSGDVIVADATPGVNKIFKITTGGAVSTIAGNGAITQPDDAFSAGPALNTPLLQPRSVEVDSQGRVIIADTGHARVIRIESNGNASLLQQFGFEQQTPNPFPSGLAVRGNDVYVALANLQTIVRLNSSATTVVGVSTQSCDYSVSNCGDGGPGISATLGLQGSTGNIPLAGLAADANGVFIGDQSLTGRGRIRYLNQSGSAVTLAGVTIATNAIDRIGGTGLTPPYDGGLATSATFNSPTGVAVDANNNLWVTDTISARLRFVNRGTSAVKIFAGTASEQTVAPGVIVTVNKNVGGGANDGVPVIQAGFDSPQGLFITSQGIYVVDSKSGPTVPMTATGRRTSTLRFINTSATTVTIYPSSSSPVSVPPGQIAKIAGGGESQGSNGDGGFALAAKFIGASDVVVDGNGNIYLTDTGGNAVRRISGSNGLVGSLLSGKQYPGLGLGPDGRLYVANYTDGTVLRETAVASGTFAVLGSGFNKPRDVAVGADGSAYVTVGPPPNVAGNHQIVQISSSGTATVIAGTTAGFAGDGGPASAAQLNISPPALVVGSGTPNQLPETVNIVISPTGEIIFTDTNNNRVRRLSSSTSTCTKTGTITIQGNNPQPQLASIAPASALVGSGSFSLTVNGSGFVPTSVVQWGGQNRTTTFVSNSQLTAAIPAGDLASTGTVNITVFNGAPGGGTSNALPFTVNPPNPVPTITSLNPNTAVEGSAGFTLTVTGTNFVNGSVVRWDGSSRATTFVSATQLKAQILTTDLVGTGQASVTVFNPVPGGGTSNVMIFNITSGQSPAPTLTSISPNSATAGGPGFDLTVTGTNFVASSKIRWNGMDLPTAFVSSAQLIAQVPANLIVGAGSAQVTVFTPTPGGGVTTAQNFTINPGQTPVVTTVSAASFLGTELAPESIVAAFGVNMATGVAVASSVPLPTTLLGTKVTVRDSAGTSRDSALFFVAPSQVNYQVPPGTAEGNATVTVTINNNVVGAGTMNVTKVAPGLFSANATGTGIASAVILRVRNGVQTFEAVTAAPIDLGPDTDTVYLLAYGVGMRGRTNAANISVNLGGTVKTLNAGLFEDAFAVGDFVGLDQVNIVLPRTLVGKGLINVVLTVDGKVSNTVQIAIK